MLSWYIGHYVIVDAYIHMNIFALINAYMHTLCL